ncbi:MAG TPA: metallophosphoesterase family protein [Candidatus Paceibacterota bacterium]|nr:metallophosphoesterase family protein [Candidatus Paceibacterota bacterium]
MTHQSRSAHPAATGEALSGDDDHLDALVNPGLALAGLLLGLSLAVQSSGAAASGTSSSIQDTVTGIALRLSQGHSAGDLNAFSPARLIEELTPAEQRVLGAEHIRFEVNVPVVVTVLRDTAGDEPFWLRSRRFTPTGAVLSVAKRRFEAWERFFPSGAIGLGVNSLAGSGEHYLVLVRAQQEGAALRIDRLDPGHLRVTEMAAGVKPYADRDETLEKIPEAWRGWRLIQTLRQSRDEARLIGGFRETPHPSSRRPDQIVLTWSGDPRTTQAIQWRTAPSVASGWVAYGKRAELNTVRPRRLERVRAVTDKLVDGRLANDPIVHRHTAELTGLEPGTAYVYCVGDGSGSGWSELAEFSTAPDGASGFSFVYMGDPQNGFERWGALARTAFRQRPDAAFYLLAGDLVNRGAERDDWDSLFANAAGILNRRPVVPALGNHDCQGGHPTLYLKQFALPRNGPPGLEAERAYAFHYADALLVVLDSNTEPGAQTAWLEAQLEGSKAKWKFVAYHHPAYSSAPNRDNVALREAWTPLFDRYQVDLALQGHDHAYLRTYPMRAGQRGSRPRDGTHYVVSVSGTKMYRQDQRPYTEVGLTNAATFQVIDIQRQGDRLVYRAYDVDGDLRDQLVIEK